MKKSYVLFAGALSALLVLPCFGGCEAPPEEKEPEVLFDSSALQGDAAFLPGYAPFALYDPICFENSVITSISFPFAQFGEGYSADSEGLVLPVFVLGNDFTAAREDCARYELDFTGKLGGVSAGDWITADGLSIEVGAGETLAFGDETMPILPQYKRGDERYGFFNRVFGKKGENAHSLLFKIEGVRKAAGEEKYISFLGDSISTYRGWSDGVSFNETIGENAVWFPNNNYAGADLAVSDTWWYRAAKELGYKIAVNNSWSGSVVKDANTYDVRAKNLHSGGRTPDLIVVFMGVNDYAAGTAIGDYFGEGEPPEVPSTFSEAYGKVLRTLKTAYPAAEIYCCSFTPDRKRKPAKGAVEEAFVQTIAELTETMGARYIDLYHESGITPENIAQYTVDKLHPNAAGMARIADAVVRAIRH